MTYECRNCGSHTVMFCIGCPKTFDTPEEAIVHHNETGHRYRIMIQQQQYDYPVPSEKK
jgi:hypothetical protein